MKIAILSDSHDNVWNLEALIDYIKDSTDALIFCGDICSPFMLAILGKKYHKPIYSIWGNNDGDKVNLANKANEFKNITICGDVLNIELDGKKIFASHYPEISLEIAKSNYFDVVCYGHNHEYNITHQENGVLVINPGTVLGYAPRKFDNIRATFVILDTQTLNIDSFEIKTNQNGTKHIVQF